MSNTMMDFMSISPGGGFPAMFNGSGPIERLSGGQKVICTPEVSLYTYNGGGAGTVPSPPSPSTVDDKGGGGLDLDGGDAMLHHSASGFQCGVCGKIFQQKNTFQNHLRSHREGEDPYQCDICGKTFAVPARLTRHYRTHTGEKPYQCEYCNKSFSVKENLSVHRRIHTKERPYKCEVCERAFEHSGKLHRHMRIHTGERPHRCQVCQKTFIQSGQLVIHLRTHTGEKPYVCKVCSKGFTCSKQLKVHSRTHTGEKPYSCDICGKSFGYNHVLKLHQVAHYGEKVYKCTICNSTFNSKKSLESHIKTHSSDPMSPSMSPPPLLDSPPPRSGSGSDLRTSSCPSNSNSNSHGAPQHSDKENRESSDSEVSSQNSPTALESPTRSPSTSPKIYSPGRPSHVKPSSGHYGSGTTGTVVNGSGTTHGSLPYPMLPPGVQIHQPPQSRTTFLYVTSKLPQVANGAPPNGLLSPGGNSYSNGSIPVKGPSPRQTDVARDKFLRQSASIREKVLASIEMFGYGLNTSDSSNGSSSSSFSSSSEVGTRPKGIEITPVTVGNSNGFGFGRGKFADCSTVNRNTMSGALVRDGNNVSITPVTPENLTNYGAGGRKQPIREELPLSYPYSYPSSYVVSKVKDMSSPELISSGNGYSFGSGGVLALALTRGSKAVVNQLAPFAPIRTSRKGFPPMQSQTPPPSGPESPPDLCLDFSRRSGSVSPRNTGYSPNTPSTTPGSTPGLSDLCDPEEGHSLLTTREGLEVIGLGKRSMSNGSNYGPRKRSSLILEKYAQENGPPLSPPPSQSSGPQTESILSQRLRQSSVIQYAERCT